MFNDYSQLYSFTTFIIHNYSYAYVKLKNNVATTIICIVRYYSKVAMYVCNYINDYTIITDITT